MVRLRESQRPLGFRLQSILRPISVHNWRRWRLQMISVVAEDAKSGIGKVDVVVEG